MTSSAIWTCLKLFSLPDLGIDDFAQIPLKVITTHNMSFLSIGASFFELAIVLNCICGLLLYSREENYVLVPCYMLEGEGH